MALGTSTAAAIVTRTSAPAETVALTTSTAATTTSITTTTATTTTSIATTTATTTTTTTVTVIPTTAGIRREISVLREPQIHFRGAEEERGECFPVAMVKAAWKREMVRPPRVAFTAPPRLGVVGWVLELGEIVEKEVLEMMETALEKMMALPGKMLQMKMMAPAGMVIFLATKMAALSVNR